MSKAILITGCSSGIGLAAAEVLHKKGYKVYATARKEADLAHLQQLGVHPLHLELADPQSVQTCAEQVLELTNGNLYGVFNNAAYGQPGAVEDLNRDVLKAQFEVNVFGTMELTNYLLPAMRQQKVGRVVFNSSLLGYVTLPYRGAYNGSKFALQGLADTLRLELRGSGVQVSVISPGPILSKFRAHSLEYFEKNIDREHSAHAKRYATVYKRLKNQTEEPPFTLPPEAVAKKLLHALTADKAKANYYVTFPAHYFAWVKRLAPTALLDHMLMNISDQEAKE